MTRTLVRLLVMAPVLGTAGLSAAAPLELAASLGLGKPAGDNADSFGMDVGGAVSVGSRLHPNFGLHLRLAADRLGPDDPPFADASMWMGRVQIEPAAHVVQNRLDFSLGPTLGMYFLRGEIDGPAALDSKGSSWGFTAGVRVNMLFVVGGGEAALGPYFAYDRLFPNKACFTLGSMAEVCDDDPDDDQGFWQLGMAARF